MLRYATHQEIILPFLRLVRTLRAVCTSHDGFASSCKQQEKTRLPEGHDAFRILRIRTSLNVTRFALQAGVVVVGRV